MNIKSRVRTIERKLRREISAFCACNPYNGKVYPAIEVKTEIDGVQTIEKPIPDFCERCGKPVEKQQLIIQFV